MTIPYMDMFYKIAYSSKIMYYCITYMDPASYNGIYENYFNLDPFFSSLIISL